MLQQANFLDDIIAAISAPLGSGRIGIVRMSGNGHPLQDAFSEQKNWTEKPATPFLRKITDEVPDGSH